MNALGLIIQREYLSRVRTKAFIITSLLTPFLLILIIGLPQYLLGLDDTDIKTVYVIDDTGRYGDLFQSSTAYTFLHITNKNAEEKMDALLQISGDLSEQPLAATFFSEQQQPPRDLIKYINEVLTGAVQTEQVDRLTASNNLAPEIVTNLQNILSHENSIKINTLRWSTDGMVTDTMGEMASATGLMLTLVMMMFITMYGSWVIQSVIEEKTNRIVEVIISSVKPFDLMMGKIVGIGLIGLTQLLIWTCLAMLVTLGIGVFATTNPTTDISELHNAAMMMNNSPAPLGEFAELANINWLQISIYFLLYFIGGYLLFASMFAMFASAANDAQEAQQLTTPSMILLFVAMYTGYAAAQNPEGAIAFWCSLIPFTSPIVMMVRAPFEVPIWQLALSLVLLFASVFFMVKLAAKIYRIGILMHGKKIGVKELSKWLRYK